MTNHNQEFRLSIYTGFELPDRTIDAVILYFNNYQECCKFAEIPIMQGYTVDITNTTLDDIKGE